MIHSIARLTTQPAATPPRLSLRCLKLRSRQPLQWRIALAMPVIHSAIWVLSPIWTQPAVNIEPGVAVPDLGAELKPDGLVASIKQALNKPAPVVSVAQAITEPMTTLSVPAEPATEPTGEVDGEPVEKSIIDQEQAIIEADGKPSDKLRRRAQLHGVPRSSKGKRRRCDELRAALQPLISVALP